MASGASVARSRSRPSRSRNAIRPPVIRPPAWSISRVTASEVTDLPEPLSPTSATVSPGATDRSSPFTAVKPPKPTLSPEMRSSVTSGAGEGAEAKRAGSFRGRGAKNGMVGSGRTAISQAERGATRKSGLSGLEAGTREQPEPPGPGSPSHKRRLLASRGRFDQRQARGCVFRAKTRGNFSDAQGTASVFRQIAQKQVDSPPVGAELRFIDCVFHAKCRRPGAQGEDPCNCPSSVPSRRSRAA